MAEQVISPPVSQASPPQAAAETRVSAGEYMERYAHDFYEWVRGELIQMAPISSVHDEITGYLYKLLDAYFALNPIGKVRRAPFVMRVDATESRREPDLQIVLKSNLGQLTDTAMIGPADICIEVVSPESVARDHGEKFAEYERGGVAEYWIIDPVRKLCRFNRLTPEKLYTTTQTGEHGEYETPLLPKLKLDVSLLWQESLPDFFAIGQAVQKMMEG